MSDQVAVMNEGQFEQIGTPQELYHDPKSAFVASFVGEANQWRGEVLEVEQQHVKLVTENGMRLVAAKSQQSSVGDQVAIFVRPEAISVQHVGTELSVPSESSNTLLGEVQSVLFNGANSRLLIQSQDGQMLETEFPQAGSKQSFKRGDSVQLNWSWEQSRCFS